MEMPIKKLKYKLTIEKANELIREYNDKKDFGVIDNYIRNLYPYKKAEKVLSFCYTYGRLLPFEVINK